MFGVRYKLVTWLSFTLSENRSHGLCSFYPLLVIENKFFGQNREGIHFPDEKKVNCKSSNEKHVPEMK